MDTKQALVITHSGSFHCDEVLAFAMIRYLYGSAVVIRTRDETVISKYAGRADTFVVDVGGVFDAQTRQYDHHQSTFTETFDERSTIRLSSSGLVYKYHGDEIITKFMQEKFPDLDLSYMPHIKVKMYDGWMKHIDANDVGVNSGSMFAISSAIYSRVGRMNLNWNHPEKHSVIASDAAFMKAADMVIAEFCDMLWTIINDHFLSECVVREAMMAEQEVDGLLIINQTCPWKGHIVSLERELGKSYLYVAYPEESTDGRWRLHAIPTSGFNNRQVIPTHLKKLPGVAFIHNAGFIAATVDKESCLALAKTCIDYFSPPLAIGI